MSEPLPPAARALVDATVAAARLRPAEGSAVRVELEAHFLDALDAGVPLPDVIREFGDPAITAQLIRGAKGRTRRPVLAMVTHAAALAAVVYALAVIRLHSAPAGSTMPALEAEARAVAEQLALADAMLGTPSGIRSSFEVAAHLRTRHSLWAETASLPLLDRTMAAADSLLPRGEREWLRDRLRALAQQETLEPRRQLVSASLPLVVDRLYGVGGRIDREGLRLLQRTKGIARPSYGAVLLEPLYFARAVSRDELRQVIDRLVAVRLSRAEEAGRRLAARL